MKVYKDVEVEVDVDISDFDIEHVVQYIIGVAESNNLTRYEQNAIEELRYSIGIDLTKDSAYSMSRQEFEEIFEVMKNSWQNLT